MNAETSDPHFQLTFKEIVVTLNDGNEILMSKCINCNFVTRYHSFCKMNHWRNCPSRWSFKYTNQGESITAICLKCHTKFTSPFYLDKTLQKHKNECAAAHQEDNHNLEENFTTFESADGIEYVRENQVCPREISGQLRVASGQNMVISAPAYKIKYCTSTNGLERYGECQKCLKTFKKPSYLKFSVHRKSCQLQEELLFSVTTQPVQVQMQTIQGQQIQFQPMILQPCDTTISSSVDLDDDDEIQESPPSATSSNRICFICNTTSSDKFVNLFETLSKHSLTNIFEFVWKFLDDQPSVRDDSIEAANSSSLCRMCLSKINAYDLANQTAAKYENELRQQLAQTEAYYASIRVQQEPTDATQKDESEQIEVVRDLVADPLEIENNENGADTEFPEIIEIDATGQVQTQDEEEENNDDQCVIELSDNDEEQTIELTDSE